jgi:hypothetical protein
MAVIRSQQDYCAAASSGLTTRILPCQPLRSNGWTAHYRRAVAGLSVAALAGVTTGLRTCVTRSQCAARRWESKEVLDLLAGLSESLGQVVDAGCARPS